MLYIARRRVARRWWWLALILWVLVGALVGYGIAQAQSGSLTLPNWSNSADLSLILKRPRYLNFVDHDGKMLMKFDLEQGTAALGPGLAEDDAARRIWRALARQAPAFQQALGEAKDESCWRTLFGLR